jgi:hypothetical protein
MGTPYSNEFRVTTVGANEYVELAWPGRCELNRVSAVKEGGGSLTFDFYNRKIIGPTLNVDEIVAGDEGGDLRILLDADQPDFDDIQIDDLLTVAGASVGGYNSAVHRVVYIDPGRRFVEVSGVGYSADSTGGTVQLDISAIEGLYQVMAQITGTTPQVVILPGTGDKVIFVNQDPILAGARNIGIKRKLYVKIAAADTYRIGIDATLSVAGEG